ncbi:hypothetical protein R6Q57_009222 [Mikania cordata]
MAENFTLDPHNTSSTTKSPILNNESLTKQFERFTSLLSEIKLAGQVYPTIYVLNHFLRSLPGKWETYSIFVRSSPDFGNLTLTQLHSKLLTFECAIDKKRKLIKSGKSTEEYVQGNMALLSHNSENSDQSYDENIGVTTGITSSFSSCDDISFTPENLCFIMDDLYHIPSDDLEEMDILNQLTRFSISTNKLYNRIGRKFIGIPATSLIVQNSPSSNVQYVQAANGSMYQFMPVPLEIVSPSFQINTPGLAIPNSQCNQPALFTQEYVDWSNMPDDVHNQ